MLKQPLKLPMRQKMESAISVIMGLHDNISTTTRQLGFLSKCVNMRRAKVTSAETRPDREIVGNAVGATRILGLVAYYKSNGTKELISGSGTVLKAYNGTTGLWETLGTGLSSNKQFNAITYNDLLLITNGTDNVMKYDGTNFGVLGGSPPKSKYIASAYQRVFLVQEPSLLRVSDIANAEQWSTGDSAAIPINDKDGDVITWVRKYKANVVVWKGNSIHEIHGPEIGNLSSDWRVFGIADVGTPNGRTIIDVGGVLYWLSNSENAKGIVRWSGGRPVLISEPVEGLINSINWAYIDNACATTDGNGNYLLSVPTGASTVPDTTLVYNTNDNSWWVWKDWSPTAFAGYRLDDKEVPLMGDTDGSVYSIGE